MVGEHIGSVLGKIRGRSGISVTTLIIKIVSYVQVSVLELLFECVALTMLLHKLSRKTHLAALDAYAVGINIIVAYSRVSNDCITVHSAFVVIITESAAHTIKPGKQITLFKAVGAVLRYITVNDLAVFIILDLRDKSAYNVTFGV